MRIWGLSPTIVCSDNHFLTKIPDFNTAVKRGKKETDGDESIEMMKEMINQ